MIDLVALECPRCGAHFSTRVHAAGDSCPFTEMQGWPFRRVLCGGTLRRFAESPAPTNCRCVLLPAPVEHTASDFTVDNVQSKR